MTGTRSYGFLAALGLSCGLVAPACLGAPAAPVDAAQGDGGGPADASACTPLVRDTFATGALDTDHWEPVTDGNGDLLLAADGGLQLLVDNAEPNGGLYYGHAAIYSYLSRSLLDMTLTAEMSITQDDGPVGIMWRAAEDDYVSLYGYKGDVFVERAAPGVASEFPCMYCGTYLKGASFSLRLRATPDVIFAEALMGEGDWTELATLDTPAGDGFQATAYAIGTQPGQVAALLTLVEWADCAGQ